MNTDLRFLIDSIKANHGELLLDIRTGYFNIYYRGNSLAKISFRPEGRYEITIHRKFFDGTKARLDQHFVDSYIRRPKDGINDYYVLNLPAKLLRPFFQREYLRDFMSAIKRCGYGEEITFEQQVITDNLGREDIEDLIIIDRQIADSRMPHRRIDLLALQRLTGNKYKFLVIEVKMGRNKELSGKVAEQLQEYINHIEAYFADFKKCYEMQYWQKKRLGLIEGLTYDNVEILPGVDGCVLVIGYSGLAKEKIRELKLKYPDIRVEEMHFILQDKGCNEVERCEQ
jgi:hypothetical protein